MTDGDCLLRAILTDPGDDRARLVYADWLEERGQETWASVMRMPEYKVATFNLWAANAMMGNRAQLGPRAYEQSATVRMGFIERVECTTGYFMEYAAALFAAHPVTDVRLTDREPYDEFGTAPHENRWFTASEQNGDTHPQSDLPHELFLAIDSPTRRTTATRLSYKLFDSPDDANNALSAACVSYGRSLAGLPALEPAHV